MKARSGHNPAGIRVRKCEGKRQIALTEPRLLLDFHQPRPCLLTGFQCGSPAHVPQRDAKESEPVTALYLIYLVNLSLFQLHSAIELESLISLIYQKGKEKNACNNKTILPYAKWGQAGCDGLSLSRLTPPVWIPLQADFQMFNPSISVTLTEKNHLYIISFVLLYNIKNMSLNKK